MSLKKMLFVPTSYLCQMSVMVLFATAGIADAQTMRVPAFDHTAKSTSAAMAPRAMVPAPQPDPNAATVFAAPNNCFLPTLLSRCVGPKDESKGSREATINTFFGTTKALSYFNQIKSIYNGSSNSATVSADLASLNFSNGMQFNAGTNIQAGSTGVPVVSSGTVPTLSAASAGQATQNMLYGGTVYATALLPVYSLGASTSAQPGALAIEIDLAAREGVDIQNFKSGTSVNATAPPSHSSAQMEGYLQYNSINTSATGGFVGAVFLGGSYGYSYTSHGYARDYGFANNVSNGMGQVSAGIIINTVATIALSRGFGPSQTYVDSTTLTKTTVNNFKSWSFGITYQSPSPAK